MEVNHKIRRQLQRAKCDLTSRLWAIRPEALNDILARITAFEAAKEIEAAKAAQASTTKQADGVVAVIPVIGPISHREDFLSWLFGWPTTQGISRALNQAVNDPSVKSVVMDFDTPGGEVSGTPELGDEIFKAREQKKIIAVANVDAASGGYWLASQASEFIVAPSGQVGSIGVFSMHADFSKALEMDGVGVKYIKAGKFKTEGNPYEPLSEEAQAAIQQKVDAYYEMFIKAVARGRGASQKAVRDGFGQGRMVMAEAALEEGMVDRIETFDGVLARVVRQKGKSSVEDEGAGLQTSAEPPEAAAETSSEDLERELRYYEGRLDGR